VLGHLLLEAALLNRGERFGGRDPAGEAFCVSNEEAVKNEDFWFSVMKVINTACDPSKVKSTMDLVFIPESPLWAIGYVSELNQKIFKGRVSLGRDIDMLTPGMLTTAVMDYSYTSAKAKEWLGYEPGFTLDEAIQKSLYDFWSAHFPGKKLN